MTAKLNSLQACAK